MNRFLLILCLLSGNALAQAAPMPVTWNNPTTRTDGSALTAIGSTKVEWGTCSGTAFGTLIGTQSATGSATTLTTPTVPPATYCVRAYTIDTSGVSSVASVVTQKVISPAPPNPPTLVSVTAIAYNMRMDSRGYLFMARVPGVSIPLGSICTAIPGLSPYGIAGNYITLCKVSS